MKTTIVNLGSILSGNWRDPCASGDAILMEAGRIVEVGSLSATALAACDVVIAAGLLAAIAVARKQAPLA
jgi:enamidase